MSYCVCGEESCVTALKTAAKETRVHPILSEILRGFRKG